MKITYNWLKEFIDISDLSPQEIAEILTNVGIEVDSVRYAAENLEKVVTGKIEKIEKHPNADKLKICQVNVGGEIVQIITGADNVFEGAVVPVALHGAKLPSGTRIKKSKLRGEVSNGMLCSESELGLTDSSEGIMILPKETEIGKDIVEVLGLNDYVIEYEITTNRPDALSVLGIARELKAVLNRNITLPEATVKEGNFEITNEAELEVLDTAACPRYTGFVLKNIKNTQSPLPMQVRLYLVGLRPINCVVDATNYVMYELGQPLHAFDLRKLKGRKVVVRRAKEGEKIITLDGVERSLTPEDLIIADAENPVAIAGIMGGENSGTEMETTEIFLESAHFDPMTVRKTSKRLGLSTDSSYRFERGADIEMCRFAAERALHLIQNTCGGEAARGVLESYPKPYTPKVIVFRPEKSSRLLGINIPPRKSAEILANLGFNVKKEQDYLIVKVPSWRKYDVSREVDLTEEVVRIYGMKNVTSTYPLMHSNVRKNFTYFKIEEIKEFLCALGYFEAINYSFVGENLYKKLNLTVEKLKKISNPLSEEWVYMRNFVFPSLVQNAVNNINRNERDVALFEVAKVFDKEEEPLHLSLLLTGRVKSELYSFRSADFYDIKGTVEALLERLNLKGEFIPQGEKNFLHPGQSAEITVEGETIGFLGKLHPNVLENLDVNQEIYVAELELGKILELSEAVKPTFSQIPKFPPVTRDIALLVDKEVPVAEVEKLIRSKAKKLEAIRLFDVYEGDKIPKGKRSVAFSLKFRDKNKTLSDEEVNGIMDAIIRELEKNGITLRA